MRRLREEAAWALADAMALLLCVALAPFILIAFVYEGREMRATDEIRTSLDIRTGQGTRGQNVPFCCKT